MTCDVVMILENKSRASVSFEGERYGHLDMAPVNKTNIFDRVQALDAWGSDEKRKFKWFITRGCFTKEKMLRANEVRRILWKIQKIGHCLKGTPCFFHIIEMSKDLEDLENRRRALDSPKGVKK